MKIQRVIVPVIIIIAISVVAIVLAMKYLPFPSPPLPNSVVEYQEHLKKIYNKTFYPLYSRPPHSEHRPKRPLELVLVLQDRNIDRSYLQMLRNIFFGEINEIVRVKKQVKMEEVGIFSEQNKARFVLIEGAAGIGKSTFCWQLCRLWSQGGLRYKWDLMIVVEIREESTRNATCVYDLLRHSHDRSVAKEIEERNGTGVFIIFDGYDEVSEYQKSNQSVVSKILTNKLLTEATVVVTSRPNALKYLPLEFMQLLNQHIILAGFNETDIDTYITKSCQSDKSLLEYLRSIVNNKPFIRSLMFNPLHCSIITELFIEYWEVEQRSFAPDTLAQLYTALLINLLQHDLPSNGFIDIDSLDDLPQDVHENLMKLAKLAADGLENRTYQYDSYHVPNNVLGLMVPTYKPAHVSKPRKYMFLYLTLQEYLSALHWYNQPNQSLIHFLQQQDIFSTMEVHYKAIRQDKEPQHSHQWPHLSVIFLAGLMGDSFPLNLIMAKNTSEHKIFSAGLLCQLLFEHQSSKHVSKMFANKTVYTDYLDTTPLYNFAIGYCIANSDNTTSWNVDMYDQRSPQYLKILSDSMHHSVNVTDWDEKFGSLINLTLEESASVCYLKIFPNLFPFTKAITELHLYGSIADEKGFSVLQNLSHYCPRLTSLRLPGLKFALKEAPHLPYETLVTLELTLPDCSLLLDRLLDYKALRQLHLFAKDE